MCLFRRPVTVCLLQLKVTTFITGTIGNAKLTVQIGYRLSLANGHSVGRTTLAFLSRQAPSPLSISLLL